MVASFRHWKTVYLALVILSSYGILLMSDIVEMPRVGFLVEAIFSSNKPFWTEFQTEEPSFEVTKSPMPYLRIYNICRLYSEQQWYINGVESLPKVKNMSFRDFRSLPDRRRAYKHTMYEGVAMVARKDSHQGHIMVDIEGHYTIYNEYKDSGKHIYFVQQEFTPIKPWAKSVFSAFMPQVSFVELRDYTFMSTGYDMVCFREATFVLMEEISKSKRFSEVIPEVFNLKKTEPKDVTIMSRKSTRVILNLDDVRKFIVKEYNVSPERVRVINLEEMTFREQVETMWSTKHFITVHGAGVANGLFMQPGGALVEMFPFKFSCLNYKSLTERHNIQYFPWRVGDVKDSVYAVWNQQRCINMYDLRDTNFSSNCCGSYACRLCLRESDFRVNLQSFNTTLNSVSKAVRFSQ